MHELLASLTGGDRRSIGEANRAAAIVKEHPELIVVLFEGLTSEDPVLRMRCADAIEKASAGRPELLVPYKTKLLREFSKIEQAEVKWHVAQMLVRLPLSDAETQEAVDMLLNYTNDRSSILKTHAMQALADFALRERKRVPEIKKHVEELIVIGTPAMKARGRKLLKLLK